MIIIKNCYSFKDLHFTTDRIQQGFVYCISIFTLAEKKQTSVMYSIWIWIQNHHTIPADFGALSCCKFPILPHPKDVLLDSDPETGNAIEEQ